MDPFLEDDALIWIGGSKWRWYPLQKRGRLQHPTLFPQVPKNSPEAEWFWHHPHRGFFSMKQFLGNAPMGTTWYNHPIRSEHWICIFLNRENALNTEIWCYEIEHDFEVAQHVSGTHCRQPTTVGVIFSVCAARLQRRQNYSWNHLYYTNI